MGVIILNGVIYTAAGGSGSSGNNAELEARISALEEKLPFAFGKTEDGEYGYYTDESEEFIPFGSGGGGSGIPLAQPAGVSLTNADESVVIKWTDPSDTVLEGITLAKWAGTLVVRKEDSAPVSKADGVAVLDSKIKDQYKTTGFTDRGLTNGTEYYYGIFPYTEQKLYTTGCVASFTPAAIYPSAPGEISVETDNGQIQVAFTKPDDAEGIRIVYKTGSAPTSETDGTYVDAAASPCTITGLTNGTEYYVKVYSYNAGGRFTAGGTASATPEEGLKIVSWADGTWREISKMLAAHYAGDIDIAEHWAVGDKRNIPLDGKSYAFVVLGFNHDNLATSINGHAKAAVSIQMEGCSSDSYCMRPDSAAVNDWESSDLRSEMRSTMLGWFPADLKSLIKNVNKKTSAGNKSSTIKTTSENLWIPSEIEVFGSTPNSYSGEGTQYQYYKNADNRRKMDYWWERSPYKSDARAFCFVESDGSAQSTSGILYIPLHVSIGLCI